LHIVELPPACPLAAAGSELADEAAFDQRSGCETCGVAVDAGFDGDLVERCGESEAAAS
jgi:hypothetical protein